MARPKEFDQQKALRKAVRLFCQQGFAATSTDELMRVMDVGRQSMYDTFGDKRTLFLKALEMYVTESVHAINVELEKPGSAISAVQNALATFAERNDLSSAEGCMGLNAISEFGHRDADVTRITRKAASVQLVIAIMAPSAVDKVLNSKVKVGTDVSAAAGPGAQAPSTSTADMFPPSRPHESSEAILRKNPFGALLRSSHLPD
jgi:AcrR family transcriptional regulator